MSRNSNGNGKGPDGPKPPYEVGYGRPPKHGQFKPGQSGNPKGRRKGSKSFKKMVVDALYAQVAVIENGRRSELMTSEVIIKKMFNQAMAGNKDAQREAIRFMREFLPEEPANDAVKGQPETNFDFSHYTTEELELLQDAGILLEGKKERPPIPMPPGQRQIGG